ncbi:polyprotein [Codonopsis torradovirus A]|uniref:polyprotein n=1 Tax=Codonopsis torradovirus A TaxID=2879515 RepID=UPI001E7A62F0|nr:polyprotein [Codonopsis torradovirus A]UBS89879.1 polyprotein [Codonopsis torradovirus A]
MSLLPVRRGQSSQAQMQAFSGRGQATAMSTNLESVQQLTQDIGDFFQAVSDAQSNSRKKKGMGCFTIIRGSTEQPITTELMEKEDQEKTQSLWAKIKGRKIDNPDSALQYFHLRGVVFIMVPHVSERDPGEVKITLRSGNNMLDVLSEKTFNLADGPAAAVMSAPFCLPLTPNNLMFCYTVSCTGTDAVIPCSVMAMWRQEISTRVAAYQEEDCIAWALEKFKQPQLFKSSGAAAKLIGRHYSTGNAEHDMRPQPFVGFDRRIKSMDVGAVLAGEMEARRRPPTVVHSRRLGDVVIPEVLAEAEIDEEEQLSVGSTHIHKFEAQTMQPQDAAMFNVANGFCGDQENDTIFGEDLLTIKSWIKEDRLMQLFFDGGIKPYDVDDEYYYSIGVLPRFEHMLKCIYMDDVDILQLKGKYPEAMELYDKLSLLDIQAAQEFEEILQQRLETALDKLEASKVLLERVADVVQNNIDREDAMSIDSESFLPCNDCFDEGSEADVVEVCADAREETPWFYETPMYGEEEDRLEAQAGDVVLGAEVGEGNDFKAYIDNKSASDYFLESSNELFDFTSSVVEMDFKALEVTQPVVVTSQSQFEVGIFEFNWKTTDQMCTQLLEVALPQAFNQKENLRPAGVELLKFFDAGILEFEAEVNISSSMAVTGELILIWDEGDIFGGFKETINQASLLAATHMVAGANSPNTGKMKFTPTGVGEFIPFDPSITSSRLGSLRLYVLFKMECDSAVTSLPGHIHLRARMLSTNIMQAPRIAPQFVGGMPIKEASLKEVNCSQVLMSSSWPTTAPMGETFCLTFSPASVFEQDGNLQPSMLCNLFRNCKWWTGECEFQLHFDRSVYHSGSIGIGFGTVASTLSTTYDIFNTTHVIANLAEHSTFRFCVSMRSWNGKNLFSTGRKSSLPRLDHQALMRIFVTVIKPLVSTNSALTSVNFYLMLKKIRNLVVGGSTPIRPVFGHWQKGKSGTDFFYSETDGPQDALLAEMLKQNLPTSTPAKTTPSTSDRNAGKLEAQISVREKVGGWATQYTIPKIEAEKRYFVMPVAPWSYQFKEGVVVSRTNPYIDVCSSFLYWKGSIRYTFILHRKQSSANVGGVMSVAFESSGYPIEPGIYAGKQPLATGGTRHWNFTFGVGNLIHSLVVEDDGFFRCRHTRAHKFDATKSRNDTLADRLGNLMVYLPSPEVINQVEIQIALGSDFQFSCTRLSTPASEKVVGDMTPHINALENGAFKSLAQEKSLFEKTS